VLDTRGLPSAWSRWIRRSSPSRDPARGAGHHVALELEWVLRGAYKLPREASPGLAPARSGLCRCAASCSQRGVWSPDQLRSATLSGGRAAEPPANRPVPQLRHPPEHTPHLVCLQKNSHSLRGTLSQGPPLSRLRLLAPARPGLCRCAASRPAGLGMPSCLQLCLFGEPCPFSFSPIEPAPFYARCLPLQPSGSSPTPLQPVAGARPNRIEKQY
jgi:hypothetical protein